MPRSGLVQRASGPVGAVPSEASVRAIELESQPVHANVFGFRDVGAWRGPAAPAEAVDKPCASPRPNDPAVASEVQLNLGWMLMFSRALQRGRTALRQDGCLTTR
jgi:hypothetical protein